jgi:hypothetical protein
MGFYNGDFVIKRVDITHDKKKERKFILKTNPIPTALCVSCLKETNKRKKQQCVTIYYFKLYIYQFHGSQCLRTQLDGLVESRLSSIRNIHGFDHGLGESKRESKKQRCVREREREREKEQNVNHKRCNTRLNQMMYSLSQQQLQQEQASSNKSKAFHKQRYSL